METITISKSDLESLMLDVIFAENNIDLFLSENYQAIRFSSDYINAKNGFDIVISNIKKMIEK